MVLGDDDPTPVEEWPAGEEDIFVGKTDPVVHFSGKDLDDALRSGGKIVLQALRELLKEGGASTDEVEATVQRVIDRSGILLV